MLGRTPPSAMVALWSNLLSSSSFLMAKRMWRGMILVFLLSLAAFPANSKTSAAKYSKTAARQTGAPAPTLSVQWACLRSLPTLPTGNCSPALDDLDTALDEVVFALPDFPPFPAIFQINDKAHLYTLNFRALQSHSHLFRQSKFTWPLQPILDQSDSLLPSDYSKQLQTEVQCPLIASFVCFQQGGNGDMKWQKSQVEKKEDKKVGRGEGLGVWLMVIMVMNSKGHNNIYDLSREIENQGKDYEGEAKKIVNAYRQVEQLKVQKDKPANKQQHPRHKPSSNYALKVKQTLSQLKNSQKKQAEDLSKHTVEPPLKITRFNYDRKLIKAGLDRVCSLIAVVRTRYMKIAVRFIKERANEVENKEILFVKKFRIFKLFRAWRDQVILEKMKRQQQEQKQSQLHKAVELAQQFRIFSLLKKSFHAWETTHKRQMKRKAYEKELRRIEMEQKLQKKVEKGDNKKKVEENHELQSKLRGFLDGLKDKIDNKDRLRTIKQKTEESDPNIRMQEEWIQQEQREMQELERFEENQRQEEQHSNDRQVIIQPPQQQIAQKKPMTNEELDLKRRELEGKHKKRKQALEKLNREKEEKRKQEEKERMELQREVQAEQKRIKQQKYRQYLKNKKEEEEWQKREKQLQNMALQFNHKRQMRYFGWLQLKNIKSLKKKNAQTMYQSLLLILYRVKAIQFVSNLQYVSSSILQMQLERMKERYERKLLTKGLTCLWENRKEQLEIKADLTIRHEVNQLKIVFSEWKRATPQMAVENFDWERPRAKRSEEFHRMQLLLKTLSALKENKRSEQQSRSLQAQKAKLKSKIKAMLGEEQQQFNYEQYCLQ